MKGALPDACRLYQPQPDQFTAPGGRHYGMDWLRIGAFGLLILFHIGMVFAPWPWVVKLPPTHAWLIAPMALVTPWRLALLFAVSGFASRKLLDRSGAVGAFARARSARLLVPLAFAMAVLVPIEMWVRVRETGYPSDYLTFWMRDYWRVGDFHGRQFPSWEHLWFVAYLWAYTMVLGALLWAGTGPTFDRVATWLSARSRILWAPIVLLGGCKLALMFVIAERQGLFTDWGGHAEYWPMFAFGFMAAGPRPLWRAIGGVARPAVIVAAIAGTIAVAVEVAFPGDAVPSHLLMAADRVARVAMAWSVTLLLFAAANRWLNRDHRWRATLAEAVFPAYLVHHPAIVLTAWTILPLNLPASVSFALLLVVTVTACVVAYAVGRRVGWLRPMIGLAPVKAAKSIALTA